MACSSKIKPSPLAFNNTDSRRKSQMETPMEKVAITIDLKKELFEDVKNTAKLANVPWQDFAASLIEAALKLTKDGQKLEAEDERKRLRSKKGN
jgi:hypothetical protein